MELKSDVMTKVMSNLFSLLGIQKEVAMDIISDPIIQKQMQQVRKSAEIIHKQAGQWKKLNKERFY